MDIKVDKRFETSGLRIGYNDELHKYINLDTKKELKGVTTFINSHGEKFNTNKWSRFKAWERVLGEDVFAVYKKKQGWQNVVAYLENTKRELKGDVEKVQKKMVVEWDQENKKKTQRGTDFHKAREFEKEQESVIICNKEVCLSLKKPQIFNIDYLEDGLYNEFFIVDKKGVFAGQLDKLFVYKNHFSIRDYKTNEKLDMNNFNGTKLKKPFHLLDDCKFSKYALQLNMYASMLESWGLICDGMFIDHIIFDPKKQNIDEYSIKSYKVPDYRYLFKGII